MIASIIPSDVAACAFYDKDLHIAAAMFQGPISIGFKWSFLAAAGRFVSRDHKFCTCVADPIGKCFRTESRENDGMRGSDPRASQHRNRSFGNHWQVNYDPVASRYAKLHQHIGHSAGLLMKLAITDAL